VDRPYRRDEHLADKERSVSGHVQHAQLVVNTEDSDTEESERFD
jgi:hypothetical protein